MNADNQTKKIVLEQVGTSTYYCTSHAQPNDFPNNMSGQITVSDVAAGLAFAEIPIIEIFPNPTTEWVNISLDLPQSGELKIKLFNILGKEVRTLQQGYVAKGNFKEKFRLDDIPNGLYILNIQQNRTVLAVRKITKK